MNASEGVSYLISRSTRMFLDRILPRIDSRMTASTAQFTSPEMMRPYPQSRRWAWTHYGVFIPELPAPFRYLNTMTFIGATGTVAFDNDYLAADDARNTATVFSSTAADTSQHHYRSYDSSTECLFTPDGSHLQWGSDLTITAQHPHYAVRGEYEHMTVDLTITATDHASWFVRNPLYEHFSLLAGYTGSLTTPDGDKHQIGGLCTVEYGRCASPQALTSRAVPTWAKLPIDFFTYQIVNIDDRTQLLLTNVRAAGTDAALIAHVRSLDGGAAVYDDVEFTIHTYQDDPAIDPQGRTMLLPRTFRWTVRDGASTVATINATVDTDLRYGHGRGYVGAFSYRGEHHENPIAGTGYFEWIDCTEPMP